MKFGTGNYTDNSLLVEPESSITLITKGPTTGHNHEPITALHPNNHFPLARIHSPKLIWYKTLHEHLKSIFRYT
jgi:hypothetical protein